MDPKTRLPKVLLCTFSFVSFLSFFRWEGETYLYILVSRRMQGTRKSICTADPLFKAPEWSSNLSQIHGTCEQSIGRNCKPCPSTQYPRTLVTIISDRIRRLLSMSGTLGQALYNVCVQQMTRPDYPVFGRAKFRGIVPQFRVNGEVSADSLVSRQPVLKQSSARLWSGRL